jgi:plastocyanin
MLFFALASLASVVSVASAENIVVQVGANGGLAYTPNNVTAKTGDTIVFQFLAKNHTVTQSTFAAPCTYMTAPAAGIDSGFQNVPAGATVVPEWSFTLTNDTTPLWFFCAQPTHCQKGMVFSVNAPADASTGKTYSDFMTAAMATNASVAGPGGIGADAAAGIASGSVSGSTTIASGSSGASSTSGAPASSSSKPSSAIITRASGAGILAVAAGLVSGLLL